MAPDSTRDRAVFVSRASFASDDPFDLVGSNIAVVRALLDGLLEPGEIAEDALTSYYVDDYVAQVNNGGFSQFVRETRWDGSIVRSVANGLVQMGAFQHAAHFARCREAVASIGATELRAFLDGTHLGASAVRDLLDAANEEFFVISRTEDVLALNAAWLRARPHLAVRDADVLDAEIARRRASLPDRDARVLAARAREPRAVKLIRALCDAAGQELVHVNAGDPTHVHRGVPTSALYFTTNEGLHHMVEVAGRARMLDRSDRTVAEIDVASEDLAIARTAKAIDSAAVRSGYVLMTFAVVAAAIVLLVFSRG